MTKLPKNDPLNRFQDGAKVVGGKGNMPLKSTDIDVTFLGNLAVVRTERKFVNSSETTSLEATITFPMPVHATMVDLIACIDGRKLNAKAQKKVEARATYEQAVDDGKSAVLHEELIRGIHMVSVGHVPPGKEVSVTSVWMMPLEIQGTDGLLRIPTTVGGVYGRSPLADTDALVTGRTVHRGTLTVHAGDRKVLVRDKDLNEGKADITLDRPIDLRVSDIKDEVALGKAADGRAVTVRMSVAPAVDKDVYADILADQSGSMNSPVSEGVPFRSGTRSKHDALVEGLSSLAESKRVGDEFGLWEFSNGCRKVDGVAGLSGPTGGTNTEQALSKIDVESEWAETLLITDGLSYKLDVQKHANTGKRYSVVLIGSDSLDAKVGSLAALTGGSLFIVSGEDASAAIHAAIESMRRPRSMMTVFEGGKLQSLTATIGGMNIDITWGEANTSETEDHDARYLGALAAGLALARLPEDVAAQLAEDHNLVCHLTSLVLVDEAGEKQEGLPEHHKIALTAPRPQWSGGGLMLCASGAGPSGSLVGASGSQMSASMGNQPRGMLRSMRGVTASGGNGFMGLGMSDRPVLGMVDPKQAGNPILGRVEAVMRDTTSVTSLQGLVAALDWSMANLMAQGDASFLPGNIVSDLMGLRNSEADNLARKTGKHVLAVLFALLATDVPDNRNAQRLVRAVLGQVDDADIRKARKSLTF